MYCHVPNVIIICPRKVSLIRDICFLIPHTGIVYVGLEKSVYLVSEGSRQVQLCAVVDIASSKRSVEFAFKVSLSINNTREG